MHQIFGTHIEVNAQKSFASMTLVTATVLYKHTHIQTSPDNNMTLTTIRVWSPLSGVGWPAPAPAPLLLGRLVCVSAAFCRLSAL